MNTLRKTNTTITVPQKINTKIEGQKYQNAKSRTDHSKSWRNSSTSTPPDMSPPTIPSKAEPFKTNKPFRGNHRNPLQAITDKMEIQHLPTLYSSDIKIATINVNSLSHEKMQLILTYIKHLSIDVLICIDTRHRDSTCRHYTQQVKEFFPGENTKILHSPVEPHLTRKQTHRSSVGGQLTILTHNWSGVLISHFKDPSNLGLVSGLYLSTGKGQLLIMGNYWPYKQGPSRSNEDGTTFSLWDRSMIYLRKSKHTATDPLEYIKQIITGKSERHLGKSTNNRTILCGDLNLRWKQLSTWALPNNWASTSQDHALETRQSVHTFYSGQRPVSWIDHHLISPAYTSDSIVTTTISEGPYWDAGIDHRPICIHLRVPGGRGTSGISKPHYVPPYYFPRRIDINLKDDDLVLNYRAQLDATIPLFDTSPTTAIASDQLLQICRMSSHTAKSLTQLPAKMGKPRSPFKNGWSPTFMAIKLQRLAIIDILGHARGSKRCARWKNQDAQNIGIKK